MNRRSILVSRLFAVLLFAPFVPTQMVARADIAAHNASWIPWLAWREGAKAYLGYCDRTSIIRNRANCNRDMNIMDAKVLYQKIVDNYREPVERAEKLITESYVNIQLVDERIQMMINEEVNTAGHQAQGQALLDSVQQMRIDLAVVELRRTELQEQVARIEQALVEVPTEDLTNQLYAVRKQLKIEDTSANGFKDKIAEQYRQYSELNSQLLDEVIYVGLQQQRKNSLQNLRTGISNSAQAVEKSTNAALAIKMMDDHTFAYIHENGSYPQSSEAVYFIYNQGFP